jgi:hypothetical protein
MGAVAVPVYGMSDEGDFEIHMDRIGKELQCRICMAAYDEATMTLCDHYFCKACITAAIAARKQCPLCKAPVTRRELRVDERMCAFVKTYRRILASHRMKNTYCSQLPASQTAQTQKSSQLKISRNKTTELTPQTRRKSTVDCEGKPPPPARGHGDSPVTSQTGHGNAGGSAQNRKRRAARDATPPNEKSEDDDDEDENIRGDAARRVRVALTADSCGGSLGKRGKAFRGSAG